MKKSWRLLEKIFSGEKTCESRWYKFRRPPWNTVKSGDTIWFKNSGEPVTIKAQVVRVLQFVNLTPEKIKRIRKKYAKELGIKDLSLSKLSDCFQGKRYCILIFFDQVERVKPFEIDKTGFGMAAAWLCVDDIETIKKNRKKNFSRLRPSQLSLEI